MERAATTGVVSGALAAESGTMLMEVLRRTHLSPPHELPEILAAEARRIGVSALVLYLVDLEQQLLTPVPAPDAAGREPLAVQGTIAGRTYTSSQILETELSEGRRLWVPLMDGTERLGVVEMVLADPGPVAPETIVVCERYAHFAAMLLVTKDGYSDVFKRLRRRAPLTTATELLRELVPPTVIATDDFVLGAMLEPAYDLGGDAYDYALDGDVLHAGIFDGVGHGLAAAGVTTFALAVYRQRRRVGASLADAYRSIDEEVAEQYPDNRYVTACLMQLDVREGVLRWISAGHPSPLLVRGGKFIKELEVQRVPPMGLRLAGGPPVTGEVALEPGDMVLLYTDGLTEARRPDGALFTTMRLAEFLERQAGSGDAAPDTLRRLREAIISTNEGRLRDDATALLIEWRRDSQKALLPQTV
ncbi:MAG TPA: PP2C family protein-serine/threonine phosphatase [Solirubrobacteraceae bacterium]|nr:PP2C family protein-serine/threonine phosphatase [Solirubrobacteraceae bacterium]